MKISNILGAQTFRTRWFDVGGTNTVYNNTLAMSDVDGVKLLAVASGAIDTTGESIPIGVILGNNDLRPTYDSTYKRNSIAGVNTQAAQVARVGNFVGAEGNHIKGDCAPKVEVAIISSETIISAPLYVSAYGTSPSILTVTTGSTDGLSYVANASDFTPVANNAIAYCRSGANKGIWRVITNTSTTTPTFAKAFPYDIAVGDTFVSVPFRQGSCRMQIDSLAMYVECSAALTTNYFGVCVESFELDTAGRERVHFRFAPDHFTFAT